MTIHMNVEARKRLSWHRKMRPLVAVGAGRMFAASLSPSRLEETLRRLAAGARPATRTEAQRARTDVVAVSMRCAGQYCLERSIAAAVLCRMRGTWPTWVSGVCLEPFAAHAWIEADGSPVGESLKLDHFQKNIIVDPEETQQ